MNPPTRRPRPFRLAIPPHAILTGGFLALTATLLYLMARLLVPFLSALLWAGVLTLVLFPVYRWLKRMLGGNPTAAAAVTTTLVALSVIGPSAILLTVLARESRSAYDLIRQTMQSDTLQRVIDRMANAPAELLPGVLDKEEVQELQLRLRNLGSTMVGSLIATLSHGLNRMLTNATKFVIDLFVVLVAIFYFLREGERWVLRLGETLPLSPHVWNVVTERFSTTLRAVVHGMLLSAAVLALLLAAGFRWFGVPLPAFLGMLAFFFAPIPFIGAIAVWAPACLWLYVGAGAPERAFGLLVYGTAVIFVVDNFLRPYLIGSIARLPVLFMLLSILGGLLAYGPLGLFLGPVLLAITLAVGGIYSDVVKKPVT